MLLKHKINRICLLQLINVMQASMYLKPFLSENHEFMHCRFINLLILQLSFNVLLKLALNCIIKRA